jgi:outer membrane protein insertion porin family
MISLKNIYLTGKLGLFSLLFASALLGQERAPLNKPVTDIVIIGNDRTKENVIMRELYFSEGDTISWDLVERSRRRLLNLNLFNQVEMQVYPKDYGELLLIIDVTERLYFYPVPILTMRERDWSKWSYGLSLVHTNFRGQNERVWAGIWFGFRPGFGFRYTDPWMADSLHLTSGLSFSKTTFNHRTLEFEERHILGEASLGKWWSFFFRTELSLNFDRINVDEYATVYMQSGQTTEILWGLQLLTQYDTRDLYFYPSRGIMAQLVLSRNGIFQEYNNYNRFDLDLRGYKKIGPVIASARAYQSYLHGDVPVYRLNYIGYGERIRGHFYTAIEGRNINVGNVELRFPIIPIRYFSLSMPPIPDVYLRNLKIGLSGGVFVDTGIIWNEPYQYGLNNFLTGFGAGMHIHLPYIEVFRIDYAFNMQWQGQIIVELGIAF